MVFGSWGIQAAGPVLARRGVGLGRDRLHERREPSNWETVSERLSYKSLLEPTHGAVRGSIHETRLLWESGAHRREPFCVTACVGHASRNAGEPMQC